MAYKKQQTEFYHDTVDLEDDFFYFTLFNFVPGQDNVFPDGVDLQFLVQHGLTLLLEQQVEAIARQSVTMADFLKSGAFIHNYL